MRCPRWKLSTSNTHARRIVSYPVLRILRVDWVPILTPRVRRSPVRRRFLSSPNLHLHRALWLFSTRFLLRDPLSSFFILTSHIPASRLILFRWQKDPFRSAYNTVPCYGVLRTSLSGEELGGRVVQYFCSTTPTLALDHSRLNISSRFPTPSPPPRSSLLSLHRPYLIPSHFQPDSIQRN